MMQPLIYMFITTETGQCRFMMGKTMKLQKARSLLTLSVSLSTTKPFGSKTNGTGSIVGDNVLNGN